MNTKYLITGTALILSIASVPAIAGGRGNGGGSRGAGNGGVCPIGNASGSGMCGAGAGSGTCDGIQQRLRDGSCVAPAAAPARAQGSPAATGTPLRDGSGKATAPGKGPKDGTGSQPRHPSTTTTQG